MSHDLLFRNLSSILVVVCLGSAQSSLNNVERYDPRTNTWAPVASMLKKRSLLNVAVLDGKSSTSLHITTSWTWKSLINTNHFMRPWSPFSVQARR